MGSGVQVGQDDHTYEWHEDWADLTHGGHGPGWTHHDVVVTGSGEVVAFHHDAGLLVFGPDGEQRRAIAAPIAEAHGMTLVHENGRDVIWVADVGFAVDVDADQKAQYRGGPAKKGQQVVKVDLDGNVLLSLARPAIPVYEGGGAYVPTAVAVDPASGTVWVGDGYGSSWIHRYSADGELLGSFNGEEADGPGRLNCPHGLLVDHRRGEPELYVADRGNKRIVVYSVDGEFRRVIEGDFNSPSALATYGEYLIVAELNARLTVCDGKDQLVCHLGENADVVTKPGWPNQTDEDGRVLRTQLLEPGKFNSPHGLTTDAQGNLFVSEWLLGGRFTKLEKR